MQIWRYLDLKKFISLLEEKALYFVSIKNLRRFDKFEGTVPEGAKRMAFEKMGDSKLVEDGANDFKRFADNYYINCWHKNEFESAAMWKLYARDDEGIAIQSTTERLKVALPDSYKNCIIHIDDVEYTNYEMTRVSPKLHNIIYGKTKFYEYEKELRAYFSIYPLKSDPKGVESDCGYYVPVDLEVLIQKIYVSPFSDDWFIDLVRKILKRYNIDIEVFASKM